MKNKPKSELERLQKRNEFLERDVESRKIELNIIVEKVRRCLQRNSVIFRGINVVDLLIYEFDKINEKK
jgi:hypothetical protein